MDILYEDNHLIVVNKRAGELVQADKDTRESLEEDIKRYIKSRDNKAGAVFLGVPHRLDRPVSGVVIFCKTSKALVRVNAMFQKGEMHKKYWAIVKQRPSKDEDVLEHYLVRNEKQNKTYAHSKPVANAKLARLRYRLMGNSERYFLLEVELLTGRHHQIRCQLSKIGSPIKGDLKYGFPRSNPNGGISLHARSVEFMHPVNLQPIAITAPLPEGDIFR
ncbi:RNA pseudouridine synthase [Bacteroidia bacterium]|nr:RNA pseudouridine synthase [Bacteroidia bacterium]